MIISNNGGTRFLQGWLVLTVFLLITLTIQSVGYKKLQYENEVLQLAVELAAHEAVSEATRCDM